MPYVDGLPVATSVASTDLIALDQGGTPNVPGTSTTRQATIAQLINSANNPNPLNVLDFGADPTGVADSAPAINAAVSTTVNGLYRDVYMPSGTYLVTAALNIANGQVLFGDGTGLTQIVVTTSFSQTAIGVIVLRGREWLAPTIRDFRITFTQPPDVVTTTTAPTLAGANTITVASVANILVGGSVRDATAAGIPNFTTVLSIVGNVVTLSANVVSPGVGSGDSIHFNTARALFQTLAGGATVGAGGTGCKYPPAIYSDTANRFKIFNMQIGGAWDGIVAGAASTIGGFFIENIEMGALNTGLFLDNSFDFGHLAHYHVWNFGIVGNIFFNVFADGQTKAADFGAVEGLAVDDFATLLAYLNFNTAASGGWFHFNKLQLDQTQMKVSGALWLLIDNVYILRAAPATATQNNVNVSAGNVQIGNAWIKTNAPFPCISVTGGSLLIQSGVLGDQFSSNTSLAVVSGGVLELDNLKLGASTGAHPLIAQTGGSGVLIVNNCQFPTNVTGVAVSIDTDDARHSIQGNNFNGWSFAPGPLGAYDNTVFDHTISTNTHQTTALAIYDPTNGAIIALRGNGTTPNKFIRASNGTLDVINSTFGAVIFRLLDNGQVFLFGGLTAGANLSVTGAAGFNGVAPLARPTITGSRGGNSALASLVTALSNYGLVTDGTSA